MATRATQLAHEPPAVVSEIHATHDDIAALAYRLWQENGCQDGTYQEDWLRAEQELTARQ